MVAWEYKAVMPFTLVALVLWFVHQYYPSLPEWAFSAVLVLVVL